MRSWEGTQWADCYRRPIGPEAAIGPHADAVNPKRRKEQRDRADRSTRSTMNL